MSHPFEPNPKPVGKTGKRPAGSAWAVLGLAGLLAAAGPVEAREVTTTTEVSLGFPNGRVTITKTWDSDDDALDRRINAVPEEHEVCPPEKKVVVIEEPEPAVCEREVVYVRPVHHRFIFRPRVEHVVIYRHPEYEHRVVYEPRHEERHHEREEIRHEERHHDAETIHRNDDGGHGPSVSRSEPPRQLFTPPSERPSRERGAHRDL